MKRSKAIYFLLILLIIPLVNADTVPHARGSPIQSLITNINDFSNYTFISLPNYPGVCEYSIKIVGLDGKIPTVSCYRDDIALSSVYAVEKARLNESYFFDEKDPDVLEKYIFSLSPVEVIKDIPSNTEAARSVDKYSSKEVTNYYTVNFSNQNKTSEVINSKVKPDKTAIKVNYSALIISFILTFLIEWAIIYFFMRKKNKSRSNIGSGRIALYVFLINILTWPIANFVLIPFLNINFVLTELIVIIAESLLLTFAFKIKYPKALLISFAANLASALLGFIIYP